MTVSPRSVSLPLLEKLSQVVWPYRSPKTFIHFDFHCLLAKTADSLLLRTTAESDQVLGMTGIAAHAQETMLETPALEVFLELLLNISRQGIALRHQVRLERGIVFVNDLVKEGALRAVAHIRRRADTRTGFPASRPRRFRCAISGAAFAAPRGGVSWLAYRASAEAAPQPRRISAEKSLARSGAFISLQRHQKHHPSPRKAHPQVQNRTVPAVAQVPKCLETPQNTVHRELFKDR